MGITREAFCQVDLRRCGELEVVWHRSRDLYSHPLFSRGNRNSICHSVQNQPRQGFFPQRSSFASNDLDDCVTRPCGDLDLERLRRFSGLLSSIAGAPFNRIYIAKERQLDIDAFSSGSLIRIAIFTSSQIYQNYCKLFPQTLLEKKYSVQSHDDWPWRAVRCKS